MKVFVNPSGQRENLGDSVLRRGYLDALRSKGVLHVYVGEHEAYVAGLGLTVADVRYSTKRAWLLAALRSGMSSSTVFAMNAGELVMGWNYISTALWQGAILLTQFVGRGKSVALGISLRPEPTTSRVLLSRMLKGTTLVTWRDSSSRDLLGVGSVVPDWAFALGTSDEDLTRAGVRRDCVAISMRGDRPYPSDAWFAAVRAIAAQDDSRIVVVEQVARDRLRCQEIGRRLAADVILWEHASHRAHERVVRDVYARSRCVISDRIHALIIGLTEGAVPIGLTSASAEKVSRTFAPVTAVPIGFEVTDEVELGEVLDHAATLMSKREEVLDDLANGRLAIKRLVAELLDV